MTETLCVNCEHLHSDAKRDRWYRWMCTAYPVEPQTNYVTGDSTEPYAFCKFINSGACSSFSAGNNIIKPKDSDNGPEAA